MQSTFNEKVLVVDDEPAIVELVVESLRPLNVGILTAQNGKEALKIFKEQPVFLIISDIAMPIMDGLELCQEVRKISPATAFIILTGIGNKNVAVDALRSGASDFIDKPFFPDTIMNLVDKYAKKRLKDVEEEATLNQEITRIFLEEARQILEGFEHLILALEDQSTAKKSELDQAFRIVHTLKGSSSTITGTTSLTRLAHSFENVLSAMRKGQVQTGSELTNLMLETNDLFNALLRDLEQGKESTIDVDRLISGFTKCLEQGVTSDNKVNSPQSEASGVASRPRTSPAVAASNSTATTPIPTPAAAEDDTDEGVLVSNEKLDHFMELAGELIAFKNSFDVFSRGRGQKWEELNKALAKICDQFQAQIMAVRKVSLNKAFTKFPRMVRKIAADTGKLMTLKMEGTTLEVDKTIAKTLSAALVHAIRNSCDHGIELPNQRFKQGKPQQGEILVKAEQKGDVIIVQVQDDGGGIDRTKIAQSAVSKGLISAEAALTMNDEQMLDLIFLPCFSTAKAVSELSGRGVGMDVIRTAVQKVNGQVALTTELGKSTTITLGIPTPKTVVVEHTVIARCDDIHIAVPLVNVADIKRLKRSELTYVQRGWTCMHRGMSIPLGKYSELITGRYQSSSDSPFDTGELIIVLSHRDQYTALRVNEIIEQVEAVVRPFDKFTDTIKGFKGFSMLTDDNVAFVISTEDIFAAEVA